MPARSTCCFTSCAANSPGSSSICRAGSRPTQRVVLGAATRVVLLCERSLAGLRDTIRLQTLMREHAPQARLLLVDGGAMRRARRRSASPNSKRRSARALDASPVLRRQIGRRGDQCRPAAAGGGTAQPGRARARTSLSRRSPAPARRRNASCSDCCYGNAVQAARGRRHPRRADRRAVGAAPARHCASRARCAACAAPQRPAPTVAAAGDGQSPLPLNPQPAAAAPPLAVPEEHAPPTASMRGAADRRARGADRAARLPKSGRSGAAS